MNNKNGNIKSSMFNPDRTKELQKDWQGYGKMSANYGLVVLFIFVISAICNILMK